MKGFLKAPIVTEKCQTFRVDFKRYDPETKNETDIETRLLKVPLSKGDAVARRHLVAGWVGCFFDSPEALERGINLAFLWNSEAAEGEPFGILSTIPFKGGIELRLDKQTNTRKALDFLSKKAVKSV